MKWYVGRTAPDGFYGIQFLELTRMDVPELEPLWKEEPIVQHLRQFLIEDCIDIIRSEVNAYLWAPSDVLRFYRYNMNTDNFFWVTDNRAIITASHVRSLATEHFHFSHHNRGI